MASISYVRQAVGRNRGSLDQRILPTMPMRWATRWDVDGRQVASPVRCVIEGATGSEPGLRTAEQCVVTLLNEGEGCEGTSDRRTIKKNGKLVGYIEIMR